MLYLDVVAIEMVAFGSPSTKVANFTYFVNNEKESDNMEKNWKTK